jgi:hypothetical protein
MLVLSEVKRVFTVAILDCTLVDKAPDIILGIYPPLLKPVRVIAAFDWIRVLRLSHVSATNDTPDFAIDPLSPNKPPIFLPAVGWLSDVLVPTLCNTPCATPLSDAPSAFTKVLSVCPRCPILPLALPNVADMSLYRQMSLLKIYFCELPERLPFNIGLSRIL